jgi:uncharacterized membrane protein (DUF441 family)
MTRQVRRRRAAVAVVVAIVVALLANVGAAALDARSGHVRRTAAEHDVRARLARRHLRVADVRCASGLSCTITLRNGRIVPVDPRLADLDDEVR